MSELVGAVSLRRYDELVAEGRDLVEQIGRCQFRIGDMALEIEPMRLAGGGEHGADEAFTVATSLRLFAEDIGLSFHTVKGYRWTSSKWPATHRQPKVSHSIHRILASIEDPEHRFAVILDPPVHERSGTRRWTRDAASRALGRQFATPVTVQEKVERIHDLAADDQVAARIASDLLRRPEVAFRVMADDDTARHMVNRAQIERAQQIAETTHAKAADTVPRATSGYDPAKKLTGRKRHLAVDLGGLLVDVLVTPADVPDRDGARRLLARLHTTHPEITIVWADSAYAGELVGWAERELHITIKIVKRPPDAQGFVVLPRRWVVERSLAWFMRARRNCRDYERLPAHAEAHLAWSAITLMLRRLTRPPRNHITTSGRTRRIRAGGASGPSRPRTGRLREDDRPDLDRVAEDRVRVHDFVDVTAAVGGQVHRRVRGGVVRRRVARGLLGGPGQVDAVVGRRVAEGGPLA
ncbi:DUF6192 family protein [Kitasatospora sp. NPDC127059]|uniref:DUF6192 family protein n=1 Tax=unclassified Kitasatospora TaxID=2633591 RepID=UPI003662814D